MAWPRLFWSANVSTAHSTPIAQALNDFERGLLKLLDRIEIKSNRGRTVPVLLCDEINQWIDDVVTQVKIRTGKKSISVCKLL